MTQLSHPLIQLLISEIMYNLGNSISNNNIIYLLYPFIQQIYIRCQAMLEASLVAQMVKNLPTVQENPGLIPGSAVLGIEDKR